MKVRRWVLALLLLVGSLGLFSMFLFTADLEAIVGASSDNVLIFLFVNFNIIFLCVSAFLVGRECVKLVMDRRRNILGARLRLRLIVPFLGLTAVPLVLLFILASGFLNRAMEGWLQSRVESTRDASVLLAKSYYQQLKKSAEAQAQQVVEQVAKTKPEQLKSLLEHQRQQFALFSVALFSSKGKLISSSRSPLHALADFKEPAFDKELITSKALREVAVVYEGSGPRRFLRVYAPTRYRSRQVVVVLSERIDPEISESFQIVRDSYNEYRQLKLFRNPLRSGYMVTFALVAGMILFAALWLVVQIARTIVEPIERLVRGTEQISKGNYAIAIDPGGDDEIGCLINSFNQMARELEASRVDAEQQRLLLESILANLSVGVVTIGVEDRALLVNKVARDLLGQQVFPGVRLLEVLSPSLQKPLAALLAEVRSEAAFSSFNVQCSLVEEGREVRLMCSAGRIRDAAGAWIATVLLLDDITELVKAQQMSAWREVARRIAHEIKNPLTPLKLSAQRLQRKALKQADVVLQEATQVIVEHVESIKRLADEFSNFARMPTAELRSVDLGTLVTEIVGAYVDACGDIQFKAIIDHKMPKVLLDPEQVRRVLVNLLDNAVSSVRSMVKEIGAVGVVMVRVCCQAKQERVELEVSDNGIGIAPEDRYRVFDPYFTRKKGGTGLGLAIVSSVIAEHQGSIRVLPNDPQGAKFIIELPISPRAITGESRDLLADIS